MKQILFALSFSLFFIGCKKENSTEINTQQKTEGLVGKIPEDNYPPLLVYTKPGSSSTNWPAIFYSPHQDDEVLGMGNSIAEHVKAGRPVWVVLITNGFNSDLLALYNKQNPNAQVTMATLIQMRNQEFVESCKTLGADRVYIANNGSGLNDLDFYLPNSEFGSPLYRSCVDTIKNTILYFENRFPWSSHKVISAADEDRATHYTNPTHIALSIAAADLYNSNKIHDVRFSRVYEHYHPELAPTSNGPNGTYYLITQPQDVFNIKRSALLKYSKTGVAHGGCISASGTGPSGLGWDYGPALLFENTYCHNIEYIDMIANPAVRPPY